MKRPRDVFRAVGAALVGLYGLVPATARAQDTVYFSTSDPGQTKSVGEWGVDTAWPSFDNVRQSIASMGVNNVDVVRLTFHPGQPLVANADGTYSLNATAKGYVDNQLALAAMAGAKPITLLPGEFGGTYDPVNWVRTIKATQEYINSRPGFTSTPIKSVEVFNEPDYWAGEGTPADLNTAIQQLKAYPVFRNTAFLAASTLNSDNARYWYDRVPAATAGSSHLLGGSLTSYVDFMDYVKGTGKPFVNPELHSLGEAIVGAEHGMTSGTWWADALRARGLFVQASDGKRLGYAEDLGRQAVAAVYRAPDGKVYAFAGGLERFGRATAYRFVSTDRDVYFNGIPVREYMLQTKPDADGDFDKYGSWSNQGADAEVDTTPGVPALDGYRWKIVNAGTGQVMEVAGGGTTDGALIRSATDGGGLNQKWNVVRTRNGYYELFNANSGRTAEVAFGSLDNGASVRQWSTADNQIQQWYIDAAGNGAFYIRNAYSNKYLTSDATNSTQSDLTGSALQQWRFVLSNPTAGPKAQYKFKGNASDSAGTNHSTAYGNTTYGTGPTASSQAIRLDGATSYVQLPGGVTGGSGDITISASVKWDGGNAWQRVFDFGNDTTSYMFLTPKAANGLMRFAITTAGNDSEQILETSALPVGQWVHLTLTLGGNTGVLYVNGKPQVAGQILLKPSDVNPTLNYIGKSQFAADPLFGGMVSDFRVYDYALDPGQVASLLVHRWTGASGSNWTTATLASPKNWQFDVAATDYANGNAVLFDDYAASFIVNLTDASVSPDGTQFDNSRNNYVLNGPGALAGSGSLTKSGTGALTINSANTYSGPTTVTGGTLRVAGSIAASSGVTVHNGGTFEAAVTQRVKALTVDAGGRATLPDPASGINVLTVGDGTRLTSPLVIAASGTNAGKVDIGGNGLLIDVAPGGESAAVTTVRQAVLAAYNAGQWDFGGITSSRITAANRLAIGFGLPAEVPAALTNGGTQFDEVSADASSVVVNVTVGGDANLDKAVNFDDLLLLAKNYNSTSAYWSKGDFNYDGIVNFDDLLVLAKDYNRSMPTDAVPGASAGFEPDMAAAFAAVLPEPRGLGLLILWGATLLRQRRRSTPQCRPRTFAK